MTLLHLLECGDVPAWFFPQHLPAHAAKLKCDGIRNRRAYRHDQYGCPKIQSGNDEHRKERCDRDRYGKIEAAQDGKGK